MSRETLSKVLIKNAQDILADGNDHHTMMALMAAFLDKLELLYSRGGFEDLIHAALIAKNEKTGNTIGHLMATPMIDLIDKPMSRFIKKQGLPVNKAEITTAPYAEKYLSLLEKYASSENLNRYLTEKNLQHATIGNLLSLGSNSFKHFSVEAQYLNLLGKIPKENLHNLADILTTSITIPTRQVRQMTPNGGPNSPWGFIEDSVTGSIISCFYRKSNIHPKLTASSLLKRLLPVCIRCDNDSAKKIFSTIKFQYEHSGRDILELLAETAEKNPLLIVSLLKKEGVYTQKISRLYNSNERHLRENLLSPRAIHQQIDHFFKKNNLLNHSPALSHFSEDEISKNYSMKSYFLIPEATVKEMAETSIMTSLLYLITHLPHDDKNLILWCLCHGESTFSSYLKEDSALHQETLKDLLEDYRPTQPNFLSIPEPAATNQTVDDLESIYQSFIEINFQAIAKSRPLNRSYENLLDEIAIMYPSVGETGLNYPHIHSLPLGIFHGVLYRDSESFGKFIQFLQYYPLSEVLDRLIEEKLYDQMNQTVLSDKNRGNWHSNLSVLIHYLTERFSAEPNPQNIIDLFLKFIKKRLMNNFGYSSDSFPKEERLEMVSTFLDFLSRICGKDSKKIIGFLTDQALITHFIRYFDRYKEDTVNLGKIENILRKHLLSLIKEKVDAFLTAFQFKKPEDLKEELITFLEKLTPLTLESIKENGINQIAIQFLIDFLPASAIPLSFLLDTHSPLGKPSKDLEKKIEAETKMSPEKNSDAIPLSSFPGSVLNTGNPQTTNAPQKK